MNEKQMAGFKAAEMIQDGMTVGLGTGSTARYLIEETGRRVRRGLKIRAVATSGSTERLARRQGIPLISIDEAENIDLTIDGVDEIDPDFNAIKGGGGALFREKIVACLSDRVVWIMDSGKPVQSLGKFPLPAEILRYGHGQVLRRLEALCLRPALRMDGGEPFLTDNGNYIADLHIGAPMDIPAVSAKLRGVVGVLETGLFLNLCDLIIIGKGDAAQVLRNPGKNRIGSFETKTGRDHAVY